MTVLLLIGGTIEPGAGGWHTLSVVKAFFKFCLANLQALLYAQRSSLTSCRWSFASSIIWIITWPFLLRHNKICKSDTCPITCRSWSISKCKHTCKIPLLCHHLTCLPPSLLQYCFGDISSKGHFLAWIPGCMVASLSTACKRFCRPLVVEPGQLHSLHGNSWCSASTPSVCIKWIFYFIFHCLNLVCMLCTFLLSDDGSNFISSRLNPGMRPGNSMAFCSA